jgi:hypothetical protein
MTIRGNVMKKLILIAIASILSACESKPDDVFQELGEAASVIVERRTRDLGKPSISYLEGYRDGNGLPVVCGVAGIVDGRGGYSELRFIHTQAAFMVIEDDRFPESWDAFCVTPVRPIVVR